MNLPKPTAEQQTIIDNPSNCKIVVAVPGSGKSTLLFQTIKHYYEKNPKPKRCLLLTFSKKSDTDNKKKKEELFAEHSDLIQIRTVDSFCRAILMDNWRLAGYTKEPLFDNTFNKKLLQKVYASLKQKYKDEFPRKDVEYIIGEFIGSNKSLQHIVADYQNGRYVDKVKAFAKIQEAYEQRKKTHDIAALNHKLYT